MKLRKAEEIPVSRMEAQAYKWAMKMAGDPQRYRAGLERWLHRAPERIAVYNRVAREMRLATWSAAQLDLPRRQTAPARRPSLIGPGRAFAIAGIAAAILAASAAYVAFVAPQRIGAWLAGPSTAVAQAYSTSPDEIRRTRLPDGSVVTLDRQSAFTIRFTAGRRVIDLDRGRVRFEVAHDASRPFVVFANGGSITATGTMFDVDVRGEVHVHLISGAVEVAVPAPSAASMNTVKLSKGQQLAFGAGARDNPPLVQPARPANARWVTGRISFEDMPLADVIAQANHDAKIKIAVSDPALLRQEVFADLDISDPQQVARKVALLLHLEVEKSQRGELILRQR